MHTRFKIAFACGYYVFLIGALSREKLVLLYAYYIRTGQPAHRRNSLSIALRVRSLECKLAKFAAQTILIFYMYLVHVAEQMKKNPLRVERVR